jgi:WD40 repeat protein
MHFSAVVLTSDHLLIIQGTVEIRSWPTGEIVSAFQAGTGVEGGSLFSNDPRKLAVGGKNLDLKIWDIETRQTTFKAKNVPNDSLDIAVPIWITDASWNNDGIVFTSTAYNQIRAYDLRQRRPVKDISLKQKLDERNHHLNCISSTPDNFSVVVGDNFGEVSIVDVLKNGRLISQYKGPKGSIRSISIHADTRTLACGGLDRYIRVFNLDTHKQVGRCYVKQKITSVLLGAVPYEKQHDEDDEEADLDWGDDSSEEEEAKPSKIPQFITERKVGGDDEISSSESVDERSDEEYEEDEALGEANKDDEDEDEDEDISSRDSVDERNDQEYEEDESIVDEDDEDNAREPVLRQAPPSKRTKTVK